MALQYFKEPKRHERHAQPKTQIKNQNIIADIASIFYSACFDQLPLRDEPVYLHHLQSAAKRSERSRTPPAKNQVTTEKKQGATGATRCKIGTRATTKA